MNNVETVGEVFREYFGTWLFPGLVLTAIAVFLIRGKKRERFYAGVSLLIMAVICSDWFYRLCQSMGIKNEYYRFLWMLPVIPICALLFTGIQSLIPWKTIRALLAAAVFLGIAAVGTGYLTEEEISLPENKYGVENRILEVSQALKDCRQEKEPVILCDEFVALRIRQLDPSVRLAAGREAYLNYARGLRQRKSTKAGMNLAHTGYAARKRQLRKFFREREVDYVILSNEVANEENMKKYGCKAVSATPAYTIFMVDLQAVSAS